MDALSRAALKIRETRRKQNLSQEELGYKAGLHRTYIGCVERNEKNMTIKSVEKIAKALGIDIAELFTIDD